MTTAEDPGMRARLAGRRHPRYPAVQEIIADFDWPDGRKMVPGSYADTLATRVTAAIVGQPVPSVTSHTYEGPGPCRSDLFGQICDQPRDDHELINEGD